MNVMFCTVMLRGEIFQQIPNKLVTIAEIKILQHIHGEAAVFNISPVPADFEPLSKRDEILIKNTQAQERQRLRLEYGQDRERNALVADIVYPGAIVHLPDTLAEIGMDAGSQAKGLRDAAEEMLKRAAMLDAEARGELAPPTVKERETPLEAAVKAQKAEAKRNAA